MAEARPGATPTNHDDESARHVGRLSRLLVALAVVMMGAGIVLGVMFGASQANQPQQQTAAGSPGATPPPAGFLPVEPPEDDSGEADPTEPAEASPAADLWSPALFRLGFSFFIGFAIAYALRSFVKLSLISAGFFAMALLGMQYAGFVEINWTLLGQQYETAGAWLSGQFDSFKAFVTGELPSAAGALGGLALGFKTR